MKIKCIISNIGTKSVPGCGVIEFKLGGVYDLPPDSVAWLKAKYPGRFVEVSNTPIEVPGVPMRQKASTTSWFDSRAKIEKKSKEDFE